MKLFSYIFFIISLPVCLLARNRFPIHLLDPTAMKRYIQDNSLTPEERCERAAQMNDAMILRRFFESTLEPKFTTPEDEEYAAQEQLSREIRASTLASSLVGSKSITFSQKLLKRMKEQELKKRHQDHD